MTEPVPSSVAVKRRQYLLLAGVGAVIVIGTVFSGSGIFMSTMSTMPRSPMAM